MVTGFKFDVRKGSSYEIRFLSAGNIKKLISLTVSKMVDTSAALIDSNDVLRTQHAINGIKN